MNLPPDKVQLLSQYDNEKKWELICDQVGDPEVPALRMQQLVGEGPPPPRHAAQEIMSTQVARGPCWILSSLGRSDQKPQGSSAGHVLED